MPSPDPAALRSVSLFADLTDDQRVTVASWLEVEHFAPGPSPLHERGAGYAFYILVEGRAHAEHDGTVLEVLEPGSVFGEMAFFNPKGRRMADIVVDTPVTAYSMFGTHFREMQMQLPDVAAQLELLFKERAERVAQADASE